MDVVKLSTYYRSTQGDFMIRILVYLSLLLASGFCLGNGLTATDSDPQLTIATSLEGTSFSGDGNSVDLNSDDDNQPWVASEQFLTVSYASVVPATIDVNEVAAADSSAPPIRAPPLA